MAATLLTHLMQVGNAAAKAVLGNEAGHHGAPGNEPAMGSRVHVELVVTPLGVGVPGLQAYHSSVLINGWEYSFNQNGISIAQGCHSHRMLRGGSSQMKIMDMGLSDLCVDPKLASKILRPHFLPNTYDLLRKNCNTFSDCMLHFLLGAHLDKQYRSIDNVARSADRILGVVQKFSGGQYRPNPRVDGFVHEDVLAELARARAQGQQRRR